MCKTNIISFFVNTQGKNNKKNIITIMYRLFYINNKNV